MRITDRFNLENNSTVQKRVKESLFADVISLAQSQFENDEFVKFKIEIRLKRIERNYL